MGNVTITRENEKTVIHLSGRIDSSNAPQVEEEMMKAENGVPVMIDLENLEYLSSAGLRVILRLRKNHPELELKNASTEVYEILDMTGFTSMMPVSRAYRRVSVEGCEVIGQGANGKVYRIDPDTVVKVYLNPDSLADIEHERDVARKALVLGIPTAISYDVVKVDDHYASMFELLNAKSFSKLLAETPENIDEYAKMYIDLLKLIHSTEVPAGQLPDQREIAIGWTEFLKDHLPKELYEKLHKMMLEIPHDDHMIHGDYHTKNIMLQNDEVILIDMDTLAIGHPVLEMGSMYNAYIGFNMLDKNNVLSFLGFPYEVAEAFWQKSLALYYGTDDKEVLKDKENKAKVVGLIRLLRRTIRRNGSPELIEIYRNELCKLAEQVDTLI